MTAYPQRGEAYWVDFSPGRGSEKTGHWSVLILQNDVGDRYAPTMIVAAITSKGLDREYPTDVRLSDDLLPKRSKVLCSQLLTVGTDRLERRSGSPQ